MRRALLYPLLITLALTATLSACGQKGPLYLPNQKKTKVPATQPPAPAAQPPGTASAG